MQCTRRCVAMNTQHFIQPTLTCPLGGGGGGVCGGKAGGKASCFTTGILESQRDEGGGAKELSPVMMPCSLFGRWSETPDRWEGKCREGCRGVAKRGLDTLFIRLCHHVQAKLDAFQKDGETLRRASIRNGMTGKFTQSCRCYLHDTMSSLQPVHIVIGYTHSFSQALLLAVD